MPLRHRRGRRGRPGRRAARLAIQGHAVGLVGPHPRTGLRRGAGPFDDGAVGPLCVLRASALAHNLSTMAAWCRDRGVELAPHGKTHMAPQLLARQLAAGACAVTVATISQVRTSGLRRDRGDPGQRAGRRRRIALASGRIGRASGLRAGVLGGLGARGGVDDGRAGRRGRPRPVDVCVEVGMPGGRTGCRRRRGRRGGTRGGRFTAAATGRRRRLRGRHRARGDPRRPATVRGLPARDPRGGDAAGAVFETDEVIVTAGGSTYFDAGRRRMIGWPSGRRHDPAQRLLPDPRRRPVPPHLAAGGPTALRPALTRVGTGDVAARTRAGAGDDGPPRRVVRPGPAGAVRAARQRGHQAQRPARLPASWAGRSGPRRGRGLVEFGISHPCTVFDKWQLIPVLDDERPGRRPGPHVLLARGWRGRPSRAAC